MVSESIGEENNTNDEHTWIMRQDSHHRFGKDTSKGKPPVQVIIDEEESKYKNTSAEFLRWHHKLGHFSPKKIIAMTR